MKTGKLLTGILAGAAVGAVAGILFASGKGSDTKDEVAKNNKEKMFDNGDKKIASLIANAKHALS